MKQGKRIVAILLVVVTIMSMSAFSVSAANTSDTTHTFSVTDDFARNGNVRAKHNDSAVYLHIDRHIYVHTYVQAQGCLSTGANRTNCTLVEGEVVAQVVCRSNIQYSIHNQIHEIGYGYASLDFRHINGDTQTTTLTYTWSPDSSGTYISAT